MPQRHASIQPTDRSTSVASPEEISVVLAAKVSRVNEVLQTRIMTRSGRKKNFALNVVDVKACTAKNGGGIAGKCL